PEPHEQPCEAEEQDNAKPGVDCTRCLTATEQAGQEKEARVEQSEPRQCEKDQARGCDPGVDAGASRVAVTNARTTPVDGIGRGYVFPVHGARSVSDLACCSSSRVTRFAPMIR